MILSRFACCPSRLPKKYHYFRLLISYGPDGAWPEGPTYWGYATKYALVAIQMLRSATGDTLGLEDAPGLATTGAWRVANTGPSDRSFNWGDR